MIFSSFFTVCLREAEEADLEVVLDGRPDCPSSVTEEIQRVQATLGNIHRGGRVTPLLAKIL